MSTGSSLTADPEVLPAPQEQVVPGTLLSLREHHTGRLPNSTSWEKIKKAAEQQWESDLG